jgi:hypothetical protein
MSDLNIWNKWGKLKTVMVGNNYSGDFFRDVKNSKVRSALQRIADETLDDLENYKDVLKDFGCKVIQPEMDRSESIMDYTNDNGQLSGKLPRGPLQVRDHQLVAGNHLYYTGWDHPAIKAKLDEYYPDYRLAFIDDVEKYHPIIRKNKFDKWAGSDWLTFDDYLKPDYFDRVPEFVKNEFAVFDYNEVVAAPSITVVGKDIYVDMYNGKTRLNNVYENNVKSNRVKERFVEDIFGKDFRVNTLNIGGHNDGCFHTIKPGAILSLKEIQTYNNTFPDWDICYLPDQSWNKVEGFSKIKEQTRGKWWVPGEEDNDALTEFVELWLQDWVGYVEETVFDVNVLVLDEHHVCVSQIDNPVVNKFLKKHKMEPVHVPWRHRYFWDGGLHCITLDLEREGTQEDYFPKRLSSIADLGFDED